MTSSSDEPLSLDMDWEDGALRTWGLSDSPNATLGERLPAEVPETPYSDVPTGEEARLDFWRSIMDRRIYHEPTRSRGVVEWERSMPDAQRREYDRWTRRMAAERITPSQQTTRSERNKRYADSHKAQRAVLNAARYHRSDDPCRT